jgi:hypothetical protein
LPFDFSEALEFDPALADLLREQDQCGERRRQATHPAKAVPELVATGPSQVFTWDIIN